LKLTFTNSIIKVSAIGDIRSIPEERKMNHIWKQYTRD